MGGVGVCGCVGGGVGGVLGCVCVGGCGCVCVYQKAQNFVYFLTIPFCSNFASMWYKLLLRNVWRDFRLPMSAIATVAWKSLNGKFTAKIDVPIEYFYVTITDADIGSRKSLHKF